jgi:hypothetical protein
MNDEDRAAMMAAVERVLSNPKNFGYQIITDRLAKVKAIADPAERAKAWITEVGQRAAFWAQYSALRLRPWQLLPSDPYCLWMKFLGNRADRNFKAAGNCSTWIYRFSVLIL